MKASSRSVEWSKVLASAKPFEVSTALSPVLALIPHADDETIGCGGLLSILATTDAIVDFVLVTDGSQSHPNSSTHTPIERRTIREIEFIAALKTLGFSTPNVYFWRLPDTQLPHASSNVFERYVSDMTGVLERRSYQTVLTPWRRDPHGDHEATTAILRAALATLDTHPHVLEYLVWLGLQGNDRAFPRSAELKRVLAIDVSEHIARKVEALNCHHSQLSNLFGGADGFTIPASLFDRVRVETEYYLEL